MDMIWKSAKLFWIVKRCRRQQRRHPKIPARENIVQADQAEGKKIHTRKARNHPVRS
jgi:hypothetical protein